MTEKEALKKCLEQKLVFEAETICKFPDMEETTTSIAGYSYGLGYLQACKDLGVIY